MVFSGHMPHSGNAGSHDSSNFNLILYFLEFVVFLFLNLFIYLFLAVLGLHFCVRAFSSCGERGPLFIAVHGPLTIATSLVAKDRKSVV